MFGGDRRSPKVKFLKNSKFCSDWVIFFNGENLIKTFQLFQEQDHETDNLYFGGLPSGTTKEDLEATILNAIKDSFDQHERPTLKKQLLSIRVQQARVGRKGDIILLKLNL